MKIACLQLDIAWEDKEKNFAKSEKLIKEASDKGAELVCLPELFATGFTMNSKQFSERIPGETSTFLAEQATKNNISLLGSLIEKTKDKPKNTCIVYNKQGEITSKYHKIHLFSLDKENKHYSHGKNISVFDINKIRASTFICYDLRFPEVFRIAADRGAKITFVPANWPSSREEHWKTLLRARAIENQAYVIGVNRTGRSPTNYYSGASTIVDPLGNVLAQGSKLEEVIVADLENEIVKNIRKKFPFLKDKKQSLYDLL